MTLESLARTIAEAQHGTDAYWANCMPAARAVVREMERAADKKDTITGYAVSGWLQAIIARPDGAQ